jgi:hypothetical protein
MYKVAIFFIVTQKFPLLIAAGNYEHKCIITHILPICVLVFLAQAFSLYPSLVTKSFIHALLPTISPCNISLLQTDP